MTFVNTLCSLLQNYTNISKEHINQAFAENDIKTYNSSSAKSLDELDSAGSGVWLIEKGSTLTVLQANQFYARVVMYAYIKNSKVNLTDDDLFQLGLLMGYDEESGTQNTYPLDSAEMFSKVYGLTISNVNKYNGLDNFKNATGNLNVVIDPNYDANVIYYELVCKNTTDAINKLLLNYVEYTTRFGKTYDTPIIKPVVFSNQKVYIICSYYCICMDAFIQNKIKSMMDLSNAAVNTVINRINVKLNTIINSVQANKIYIRDITVQDKGEIMITQINLSDMYITSKFKDEKEDESDESTLAKLKRILIYVLIIAAIGLTCFGWYSWHNSVVKEQTNSKINRLLKHAATTKNMNEIVYIMQHYQNDMTTSQLMFIMKLTNDIKQQAATEQAATEQAATE